MTRRSKRHSPEQIVHKLRDEYCIARAANSIDFSVRCIMLCGLFILIGRSSAALLAPGECALHLHSQP